MGIKWVRAQTLNKLTRRSNAGFHLAATTQNTPKECAPFLVLGDADYRGAFRGYKNSRDTDGKRDRDGGRESRHRGRQNRDQRPRILLKSAAPLPRM